MIDRSQLATLGRFLGTAVVLLTAWCGWQQAAALPAFPGAEGFGAQTPGGRGGRVIEVTSLGPDGPGSLRAALAAEGPRIVVFRVGGTIHLRGDLSIGQPFITIAGQTAPGDGICLRGGGLRVGTHDVIIRHLRVRVGDSPYGADPENRDCIDIAGDADRVYNVVIDHCSFSWSTDENVTTWYGPRDVTIQWCITSESLLDSLHPKGPHGMGMLLGSQDNTVTVHHCLLAHNSGRNPLIGDTGKNRGPSVFDFRNNVVYNHGPWSCSNVRGTSHVNYVGNTIKMGPDGFEDRPRGVRFDAQAAQLFFVSDNVWPGGSADDASVLGDAPQRLRSSEPIAAPPVTTQSAAQAYEAVLRFAGATRPMRDVVDARVVEEARTGTGAIIDSPDDVGGWPEYRSAQAPPDADHDGMPEEWERQHGLAPNDAADGPQDLDGDGYTNVEEYLNDTDPAKRTSGRPLPHKDPVVQRDNAALRFGAARERPQQPPYDPAARQAFVERVKASGREVAEYLGISFVPISPGTFMKGPIKVALTKPFEMAAHEVTQAQWSTVMGAKPWLDREFAHDIPDGAATHVSWRDCQEFVARLNACGDRAYRLPTEAEWDYACRAGTADASGVWFAEDQIDEFAWHRDNTVRAGQMHAHPVGKKKPNPWGLFDMAGNAAEWCHDWFEYQYWRRGTEKTDPGGAEPGSYYRDYHVVRGGSFYHGPRQILLAPSRASHHRPGYRNFDVGFRLARRAP